MWKSLAGKWSKRGHCFKIQFEKWKKWSSNKYVLYFQCINAMSTKMYCHSWMVSLSWGRWGRQWSDQLNKGEFEYQASRHFCGHLSKRPIPGAASWTLGMNWIDYGEAEISGKSWDTQRLCCCWGKAICCGQQKWSSIYWLHTLGFSQCSLWFCSPWKCSKYDRTNDCLLTGCVKGCDTELGESQTYQNTEECKQVISCYGSTCKPQILNSHQIGKICSHDIKMSCWTTQLSQIKILIIISMII